MLTRVVAIEWSGATLVVQGESRLARIVSGDQELISTCLKLAMLAKASGETFEAARRAGPETDNPIIDRCSIGKIDHQLWE